MEEMNFDPAPGFADVSAQELVGLLMSFAVAVARTHPDPAALLRELQAEETAVAAEPITNPTPTMVQAGWVRKTHRESLYRVLAHRLASRPE